MCVKAWTTKEGVTGSAEGGCATILVSLPVPEGVIDTIADDEDSGASAIFASILALASLAAYTF